MKIKDLPNRIQALVSEIADNDYDQDSYLSSVVDVNNIYFWKEINKGNFKPFYKKYGFVGNLEVFPYDIVMRMCDEQVKQGNPWDVSVFEKDRMSSKNYGGFDWYSTEDGGVFWAEISYANFKPFYEKYYNKRDTVAVNKKVMNNNKKVMNNNGEVMNSYVYKVVPAETEGCCYGCCFWDNNNNGINRCLVSSDSTIDCGDVIFKKVPRTTKNNDKKDDGVSESIENELDYEYVDKEENKKDDEVMNTFDYKIIEGDGTCNGCCFDDGDKGCCFYDYVKDIGDDIIDNWSCGTNNIYIKVPKQTQLKYATNQGNVSATMDLLPPYDNLELENVDITDNNQLTIYWKEKENSNITFDELLEKNSALKDTFKEYSDKCPFNESLFLNHGNYRAMMAYLKISHLMPYYGGEVSRFNEAYRVIYKGTGYTYEILPVYNLSNSGYPLFKTKEYAEKFMSREENVQLIKDIYLI